MKSLLMNKRGDETDLATWIIATIVVSVLLIVYLIVTLAYGQVSMSPSEKVKLIGVQQNEIGLTQSFAGLLNSPVYFNDRNMKMSDAILLNFDSYFDSKNNNGENLVDKYGFDNYNDITRTSRSQMVRDGFNGEDVDRIIAQNNALASEIQKKLNNYCKQYKFAVPFGLITEKGLESSDALGNRIYFVITDPMPVDWTSIITFQFSYRGKVSDFRFTELKECSNGGYDE